MDLEWMNKARQIFKKYQVLFFVLMFLLISILGVIGKHTTATMPRWELVSFNTANMILAGDHKYGIVKDPPPPYREPNYFTHYPNGPTYVLLPFILFGVRDMRLLRIVPLSIAAFVISLFFFYFLKRSRSQINAVFILLAFISILLQPGIIGWMAALQSFSYQMTMVFLIILAGYFIQDVNYIFLLFGFLCGWIGYDFIPAQILTMLIVRYIKHSQVNDNFINNVFLSFKEMLFGVLGVILAIGSHFIQNALYFGSFKEAFLDLFGAAEARMFLNKGFNLNPTFVHYLMSTNAYIEHNRPVNYMFLPGRLPLLLRNFWIFISWSRPIVLIITLAAGLVSNIITLYLNKLKLTRYLLNLMIVSILSISASVAWLILMRYHAGHIWLPRLFYVAYINIMVFMIVANEKPGDLEQGS